MTHHKFPLPSSKKPHPHTNFAVQYDGAKVSFRAVDNTLVFVYYDPHVNSYISDFEFESTEMVGGYLRVNNSGNVVFYQGMDGVLHQLYHDGHMWNKSIVMVSGDPLRINGTFDITADRDIDTMQIYYRGENEFVNVAYHDGGNWIAGDVFSECGKDSSQKCSIGGYMRYANGCIVYEF